MQTKKGKSSILKYFVFFAFIGFFPLMSLLFSKTGLDTFKKMKSEMPLLKDSIKVKSFSLENQNGLIINQSRLLDNLTVANFIDASCQASCDSAILVMQGIQKAFAKKDKDHLVFLTHILTEHTDSQEILESYVNKWKVDTSNWHFVLSRPSAASDFYQLEESKKYTHLVLAEREACLVGYYDFSKELAVMMAHMAVIVPRKGRKKLEYKQPKNRY